MTDKARDLFVEGKALFKKVGALAVSVSEAGAEVVIDGAVVGVAPLEGPVFVEPGSTRRRRGGRGSAPGWM